MNYWFIYRLLDGIIMQPTMTSSEKWTNIPDGCGVIGPLPEDDQKAKDAFENLDFYTVQDGSLVPMTDIEARRAAREAERKAQQALPNKEDRIAALESAMQSMMGL